MVKFRVPRQKTAQQTVFQQSDQRYSIGPPVPEMNSDRYYLMSSLWCITYYYNPLGMHTRLENFIKFHSRLMRQTKNLLVVEVALKPEDFVLDKIHDEERLVQLVDTSYIWQKERVFNLCTHYLPATCKKIVWLDCDILFDNNDWVYETSNLLDHYKVVQPYYLNARLPPTISNIDYGIDIFRFGWGFGDEQKSHGDVHAHFVREQTGQRVWNHPGYACGFQRGLFEKHGMYDRCPAGSSDNLTYRGILNDYYNKVVVLDGYNDESKEHYWKWAKPIADDVGMNVNFSRQANVFHLYHGRSDQRQYLSRLSYLKEHFNHGTDLEINRENGCYKFVNGKEYINKWLINYLVTRKDDEHHSSNRSAA